MAQRDLGGCHPAQLTRRRPAEETTGLLRPRSHAGRPRRLAPGVDKSQDAGIGRMAALCAPDIHGVMTTYSKETGW
jgi:hypothetical protein